MDWADEKAKELAHELAHRGVDWGALYCASATIMVAAALRSAREEERARCAGIARQEFAETPGYSGAGDIIARAIEADPNLQKMQIAPSERAGDRDSSDR